MSECVIFKLVSGDTLIGYILNDSGDTLIVKDPIALKTFQVKTAAGIIEKTVTNPYCSLTPETEFAFDRRHIIFVKPLHPSVEAFYYKLVTAFDEEQIVDEGLRIGNLFDRTDDYVDDPEDDEPFLIVPDTETIH